MSDVPPKIPPLPPASSLLSGCLTALMGFVGALLMLPGLCAVLFGARWLGADTSHDEFDTGAFILIGLVLGSIGVVLIWATIRRRRP